MAATMMIVSGKIVGGSMTMKIALSPLKCPTYTDDLLAAIERGHSLYERGDARSACMNQDEEAGWDEAAGCMLTPYQEIIDFAAEAQELEDAMLDEEWIRRGC